MSESPLNILSDSNKDIDNQKLMDYISGRLSEEGKHEVEKWMIDNPFFNEAVEGLQHAGGEGKVQLSVDQINRQLAKYLRQRKVRHNKLRLMVNGWAYVAVVIILILIVLGYFIITRFR